MNLSEATSVVSERDHDGFKNNRDGGQERLGEQN